MTYATNIIKVWQLVLILFLLKTPLVCYGQKSDFDNEEYRIDLKQMDLKRFKLDYSNLKTTLNYGIHQQNINYKKSRGYARHWNSKDQHLGFIYSSITNKPIQLRPVVLGKIKSENQRFFKVTYMNMDDIVYSLSDEIIAFLISNLDFKDVDHNYKLEKLEDENFKNKIFLHSPHDNLDKVLKIDYNVLSQFVKSESYYSDSNILIPSFLFVKGKKESYLHVDLQLLSDSNLIFRTSSNVLLKEPLNNIAKDDALRKSIVESIFHQINLE